MSTIISLLRYLFLYPIKRILQSYNQGRFFPRVTFLGRGNVYIESSANIESGSLIKNLQDNNLQKSNVFIGSNSWIGKDVEIDASYGCKIFLGSYVSVQDRSKILGNVSIYNYTLLAPDVFISSGNHDFKSQPSRLIKIQDSLSNQKSYDDTKIQIDEDCWIGKNVFIKPGVKIGRGSVIGANSMVLKDVFPYSVIAGTTKTLLANRLNFDPPSILSSQSLESLPYFYFGFNHFVKNFNEVNQKGIFSLGESMIVIKKEPKKYLVLEGGSIHNNQSEVSYSFNNGTIQFKKIGANSCFEIRIDTYELNNSVNFFSEYSVPKFLNPFNIIGLKHLINGKHLVNNLFITKVYYNDN